MVLFRMGLDEEGGGREHRLRSHRGGFSPAKEREIKEKNIENEDGSVASRVLNTCPP